MTRAYRRLLVTLALVVLAPCAPRPALAQPFGFIEAPEHVKNARQDERYVFCSKPKTPMTDRQRALCPMAADVEGCEGFVAACKADLANKEKDETKTDHHSWLEGLASFARGLAWMLLALVVIAIAIPIFAAILAARRNERVADKRPAPNTASIAQKPPPPEAETISDAEAALRDADAHARRGELGRALSLYLAATLAALDRRGAIRLARHRTNGEYVRACSEDRSRADLREIVRAVDRVEFGKVTPTAAGVAAIASRASSVVRAPGLPRASASIATTALSILVIALVLPLAGCGGRGGSSHRGKTVDDPAGDQLPIDVLTRSGYTVGYLDSSLGSLPIPREGKGAPVIAVDLGRVHLEDDTVTHLMRWVDEGGVLMLFGPPNAWPKELHAEPATASPGSLDVISNDVYARGARLSTPRAVRWADAEPIGWIGKSVHAAHIAHGKGVIVGIASAELFTNVGVARPDNAAVFVAFFDIAMSDRRAADARRDVVPPSRTLDVRVARRQDGIPPAGNPISALAQAGLGKGLVHAVLAALVLFLAVGIRHARPRPVVPPARRAFAEHVEATGAFYGRAGALGHALASYGRYAEMRLRERVPRGADPAQFLAARAKVPPENAARVWKRATEASADDPPRGDELTTIRDLGAMLAKALETT
jgi:hypothetical protein